MSIYLQDVSGDCSKAIEEMKTGKHVILTKEGVPVAFIQPLCPATEDEEREIQEMIDSGVLQPGRRLGTVQEWKWKSKPAGAPWVRYQSNRSSS